MRKLLFALLVVAGADASAQVEPGRLWSYQYLLATSVTERQLAPITEHIVHNPDLQVSEVGDFAAEVLLARFDDKEFPLQNKLRLIRVIGSMRSTRYDAVLDLLDKRSTRDETFNELSDARDKGRKHVAASPYVPGTIDIHAIARDMETAALAAKPTTEQGRHLAEFKGSSIDELFAWAGKPHQIVSGQTRVSDGLLIHVKIQRMTFFYRGLGRVVFAFPQGGDEWEFQSVVADPMAFEQEFPYRDRAQELGLPDDATLEMQQLVSNYTASIRYVAEKSYLRGHRTLEFMDTAAEILISQFQTANDPVKVDMYAWLCRVLTRDGGSRYAAILRTVANQAADSKLQRYARQKIEANSSFPPEPYVPGTISLDAQRAKYPPLYPDSTWQSGRL
jgi:hypothetical protein